jgi:NAD(P)-dependent dehydrogenase (short-subunit alcohol dehydrogenase family)
MNSDSKNSEARLAGRTALVSGAAGDIGAATGRRLLAEGADVVLVDRDEQGLAAVVESLSGAGPSVEAVVCDQSDPEAVERLFSGLDRVDVCFANAGYGRFAAFLDQDLESWRRHLDVNLTGTFLVCQAAARLMVRGGRGGAIVINASTAAVHSTPLFGAYAASKAGVEMLARTMADELGPEGIRVNSVCPGVIETGMTGGLLDQADGAMRTLVERETPVGRIGRAEDIAAAVAFLAGEDAGYVSGATLLIDGGQTLRGWPRWFHRNPGADPKWRLVTEAQGTPVG